MDDMPGAAAAWDVPAAFGDTAGASWGGRADLGDFSWFGSPLEADLAPLMQPMQPVGLPLPPPPLPLAADPLGQGFELLLAQSQGAAQPQWVQQFAQPQYQQQQPWDLIQPAPQQPAGGDGGGARSGRRAASAADAQEARRVRNRAGELLNLISSIVQSSCRLMPRTDTHSCTAWLRACHVPQPAAAQARFREKQKASYFPQWLVLFASMFSCMQLGMCCRPPGKLFKLAAGLHACPTGQPTSACHTHPQPHQPHQPPD